MVEFEDRKVVVENVAVISAKPFVVVGIPAFNEERTIAKVVLESQKFADKVVVCDDGSSDMTAGIAERMGAQLVRHGENLGYGAAIQSLFEYAKEMNADILVTLDADGQHNPSEILAIVKPIVEGKADIVIGSRFVDERMAHRIPWYRRAGIKVITKMANGNSKQKGVTDAQSGFRAYSRRSFENLSIFEDGMGVSAEILFGARKQGMRIFEVSSSCSYGVGEKTSTHNPIRHGAGVIASIVKLIVEDKPLTILGISGVLSLIAGAIFGIWMVQIYAVEHRIVTNIALASVTFVLIGFFSISTAITLYAISRIARKNRH